MSKINKQSVFYYNSDIGRLVITTMHSCLIGTDYSTNDTDRMDTRETAAASDINNEVRDQLKGYFAGRLKQFNLPVKFIGSKFDILVWNALLSIGYGKRVSYKDIAILIGNPKSSRAVGGACNRNPISIIVPCHRVVGSNGALTGYAGGLDIKRKLLEFEDNNSS